MTEDQKTNILDCLEGRPYGRDAAGVAYLVFGPGSANFKLAQECLEELRREGLVSVDRTVSPTNWKRKQI